MLHSVFSIILLHGNLYNLQSRYHKTGQESSIVFKGRNLPYFSECAYMACCRFLTSCLCSTLYSSIFNCFKAPAEIQRIIIETKQIIFSFLLYIALNYKTDYLLQANTPILGNEKRKEGSTATVRFCGQTILTRS
jgi:hypothetical protein